MQPNQFLSHFQDEGYAFISQLDCFQSTREVASRIGKVIEIDKLLAGSGIPTVQTLRPRSEHEASSTQYSGVFGLSEFPLHTDLAHWAKPPRYMMLRCVVGEPNVATKLLSSSILSHKIGKNLLRNALVRPRQSNRFAGVNLLPIIFSMDQVSGFRWDSLFLTPMNAAAQDVFEFMNNNVGAWKEEKEIILSYTGDTLLIDNWRILHGRGDANMAKKRVIERVYLSEIYK